MSLIRCCEIGACDQHAEAIYLVEGPRTGFKKEKVPLCPRHREELEKPDSGHTVKVVE